MPLPRQYERVAKGKRLFFFLVESHPDRLNFHHMNIFQKRFSVLMQYPLQTMRKVTKLDLTLFCLPPANHAKSDKTRPDPFLPSLTLFCLPLFCLPT
jgi:hypothetical protein